MTYAKTDENTLPSSVYVLISKFLRRLIEITRGLLVFLSIYITLMNFVSALLCQPVQEAVQLIRLPAGIVMTPIHEPSFSILLCQARQIGKLPYAFADILQGAFMAIFISSNSYRDGRSYRFSIAISTNSSHVFHRVDMHAASFIAASIRAGDAVPFVWGLIAFVAIILITRIFFHPVSSFFSVPVVR